MSPVIEILISPTGDTTIETRGFAGPVCRQATQALEASIGIKQFEKLTAEYHQSTTEEAGVSQRADGVS